MNELDEFRSTMLARQAEAEHAIALGDPAPRMELWSRQDPVTLFGAATGGAKTGWDELSQVIRWVASTFSEVSDFRFDVDAAGVSGDLAYSVGYERFYRFDRGSPGHADHGPRHSRLPPRGWRVEDRPSPRRLRTCRSSPPVETAAL